MRAYSTVLLRGAKSAPLMAEICDLVALVLIGHDQDTRVAHTHSYSPPGEGRALTLSMSG